MKPYSSARSRADTAFPLQRAHVLRYGADQVYFLAIPMLAFTGAALFGGTESVGTVSAGRVTLTRGKQRARLGEVAEEHPELNPSDDRRAEAEIGKSHRAGDDGRSHGAGQA